MRRSDLNSPTQGRWSYHVTLAIDVACLVALMGVMASVIYGLTLRAQYERSYVGAVVIAILGAATILIGLAQQAIAARDAATWREMAEWQIRAARDKLSRRREPDSAADLGPEAAIYYEYLVEALIEDMQRGSEGQGDGR